MSIPAYADWVPLPPATTSTTLVSYTDPSGEVWVARSSVNSGAWKRARGCLHCRVYKNSAFTVTSSPTTFVWDTAARDPYGLYNLSNGQFTPLIDGLYMFSAGVSIAAASDTAFFLIPTTIGGGFAQAGVMSSTGYGITANLCLAVYLSGQLAIQANVNTSGPTCNGQSGSQTTFASFTYLGTG